ncbi:TolB family protein [Amycolatopsis nigrescens]|uniref:TolB family protein n=1 Tax=Amycolatopsis nigrescens TaxID=381445 RepID=UPI000364B335|nr:hypothetical protein [Amycolatopsis nigrescens]
MNWLVRNRIWLGVAAIVAVLLTGGGYLVWTSSGRQAGATAPAPAAGDLRFVDLADGQDRVVQVRADAPDGPRAGTALRCQRVYESAGRTVCLRLAGPGPSYQVAVLGGGDEGGGELRTVGLPGIPSRARISASGQVVSWTSFVTGDSYTVPGGFSTRSGVLDLRTGELTESLEHFAATLDGVPYRAADVNYWGITVAGDDRTFYATLATNGRTWLVRGDLVTRTVTGLRQNAECPSLSPDGSKVAYKKRLNRLGQWQLAVLDLGSGEERLLPDTTGIDDQAAWLDEHTLAYGAQLRGRQKSAVFFVPADGSAGGRLVLPDAASPAPVQ